MWVTKLLISPVKIRIFCPKTSKFAFLPGLAGSFGALLVGWLVVVARGLYLAIHLFTLSVKLVPKHLISPVKIKNFRPKTTKFGIFGHFRLGLAGSFDALLVGCLVVVARGLYLARHLFTLFH